MRAAIAIQARWRTSESAASPGDPRPFRQRWPPAHPQPAGHVISASNRDCQLPHRPAQGGIHTYTVDCHDKGPRAPQHRGNHRSRGQAAIALPLLHPRTPNRGWSTVALFPVPPDSYAPPRCHAPPEGGQGPALSNQTSLSQEGLFSGALARDLFQPHWCRCFHR